MADACKGSKLNSCELKGSYDGDLVTAFEIVGIRVTGVRAKLAVTNNFNVKTKKCYRRYILQTMRNCEVDQRKNNRLNPLRVRI